MKHDIRPKVPQRVYHLFPHCGLPLVMGPNKKEEKRKEDHAGIHVCMSVCNARMSAAGKPQIREVFLPKSLHAAPLNPDERLGQL